MGAKQLGFVQELHLTHIFQKITSFSGYRPVFDPGI